MDAETLHQLGRRNKRDKARWDESNAALVAAIWEADDEGMRQVDIVRAVKLTRERVRQVCDPGFRKRNEGRIRGLLH